MAAEMKDNLLKWTLLWLLCTSVSNLMAATVGKEYRGQVHASCYHTRFPRLCIQTLMDNSIQQSGNILIALVEKVMSETAELPSNAKFSAQFGTSAAVHQHHYSIAAAHEYCDEAMDMSLKRLNQTAVALKKSSGRYKQDIQTWLSAVLTFQQGCKDAIIRLNPSQDNLIANQITDKMDHLIQLGSNALALINRLPNSNTTEINPVEKNALFPSWISAKDQKFLQASNKKGKNVNAIVAKDGSGDFKTIKEAINAAPSSGKQRYVIYVKAGVYKEKIWTDKDGLTLIGDGKYSTIIVASSSVVKSGSSLYESATFTIKGERFIAKDIGFRNDAGPTGQQAIALYISSDRAVLYRCSIVGYQDTLFAEAFRQFYRDCDISGTVDFIFGNAAAVFQNCNLMLRRPLNDNVILANGRNHPEQNSGFSLHRCKITSTQEFYPVRHSYRSFLGRPWKPYSRAVVMETQIDDAIVKEGWKAWPGVDYSETLYFAEYANFGAGASTSKRVEWSGYHVIGSGEASKFTIQNFIAGDSWISSTGVPFSAGLLCMKV